MKAIVVCLVFTLAAFIAGGQDQVVKVFGEVRVSPPKFMGFEKATNPESKSYDATFNDYLENRIVYPELAVDRQLQGTEVVKFVVDIDGKLTDFKVVNSISKDFDEEVIAAIESTAGMWKPGTNNDDIVAMEKEVSVTFKLGQNEQVFSRQFIDIAKYFYKKGNKKFLNRSKPGKAVKFYSAGLNYLPHDQSLLIMRGICYFALGELEKAAKDWSRLSDIDGVDESFRFFADEVTPGQEYGELLTYLDQ